MGAFDWCDDGKCYLNTFPLKSPRSLWLFTEWATTLTSIKAPLQSGSFFTLYAAASVARPSKEFRDNSDAIFFSLKFAGNHACICAHAYAVNITMEKILSGGKWIFEGMHKQVLPLLLRNYANVTWYCFLEWPLAVCKSSKCKFHLYHTVTTWWW